MVNDLAECGCQVARRRGKADSRNYRRALLHISAGRPLSFVSVWYDTSLGRYVNIGRRCALMSLCRAVDTNHDRSDGGKRESA